MVNLKAFHVNKEISIKKVRSSLNFNEISATKDLIMYKLNQGFIYVYSFGSIVFIDLSKEERQSFFFKIKEIIHLRKKPIKEEYEIVTDKSVKDFSISNSEITLKRWNIKSQNLISFILAQSIALEHYESVFVITEKKFAKLNKQLMQNGKITLSSKKVLQVIARNNNIMQGIVSGINVLDKPDSTWESSFLDKLHHKLVEEFEIEDRFENLNSKMEFVQENYKLFLESLRSKYDSRLEWIIIILIIIEIFLFLYELGLLKF